MSLPMQKATYSARATSTAITYGDTKNGDIQIGVEFEVYDQEGSTGETITWIGFFTDKTAARSIESLQVAGWQGDDLFALKGVPGSEALPGDVELVCEPEEYEGEWKLKVRWVNRPGGGRFKFKEETADDKLRAFSARMKATVQSVRAQSGAPRKPAQQRTPSAPSVVGYDGHPNAPGNGRDDIPF